MNVIGSSHFKISDRQKSQRSSRVANVLQSESSRNFWKLIEYARHLSSRSTGILDTRVLRNSFMAGLTDLARAVSQSFLQFPQWNASSSHPRLELVQGHIPCRDADPWKLKSVVACGHEIGVGKKCAAESG